MKKLTVIFLLPLIITGVTSCSSLTPIETQSVDQHEVFVKTLIEEITGVKTLP